MSDLAAQAALLLQHPQNAHAAPPAADVPAAQVASGDAGGPAGTVPPYAVPAGYVLVPAPAAQATPAAAPPAQPAAAPPVAQPEGQVAPAQPVAPPAAAVTPDMIGAIVGAVMAAQAAAAPAPAASAPLPQPVPVRGQPVLMAPPATATPAPAPNPQASSLDPMLRQYAALDATYRRAVQATDAALGG